jgi:hypothetical protein
MISATLLNTHIYKRGLVSLVYKTKNRYNAYLTGCGGDIIWFIVHALETNAKPAETEKKHSVQRTTAP